MFTPIGNQKLLSVPPYGARSSFKVWSGPRPSSGGDFFRLTPARGFWAVTSAGNFRAGLPGGAFHARVGHRLPTSDAMNSFRSKHHPTSPKSTHQSHSPHEKPSTRCSYGVSSGLEPLLVSVGEVGQRAAVVFDIGDAGGPGF